MYGFQPKTKAPQESNDGGLVARMKSADAGPATFGSRGLSQLRDLIPKMEAMGYPQAPTASDPRAAQLQAMIPQMEAMGFKQQPQQYFANGGMVRGAGTGTSDSIQARLSHGEYVLPADTVRAVGVGALDAMREATHKPVKGEQSKAARGFFAGGTPGGVGAWFQDQQRQQVLGQGAYAPGTRGAQLVAAEQQKAQDRAATGKAIVDAIKAPFSKPSTQATPSLTAPAISPEAPAQNPTDMRLASGVQRSPMAAPVSRQAAASAPQALSYVGAMAKPEAPAFDFDTFQPQSGEGAFRNEQTGRVTRLQSEPTGARQQLATPPRGIASYASEPQRQDVRAPVLNPNGGVFSSMVDFTNQAGQAMQAIAANKGMRHDRKDALDQQRVGLDAASTLAKIDQGYQSLGLDGRRADTADRLAGVQEGEFGLKREAQGFQTRAASRLEDLQNSYMAEQDPAKRSSIVQRMRELQDKSEGNLRDNFMPLGGGQEWDSAANTMRNIPQRLIDLRTLQEVGVPVQQQGQGGAGKFEVGQVYRDSQTGAQRRWNGQAWEKV